jgi:hypothetical protein
VDQIPELGGRLDLVDYVRYVDVRQGVLLFSAPTFGSFDTHPKKLMTHDEKKITV